MLFAESGRGRLLDQGLLVLRCVGGGLFAAVGSRQTTARVRLSWVMMLSCFGRFVLLILVELAFGGLFVPLWLLVPLALFALLQLVVLLALLQLLMLLALLQLVLLVGFLMSLLAGSAMVVHCCRGCCGCWWMMMGLSCRRDDDATTASNATAQSRCGSDASR